MSSALSRSSRFDAAVHAAATGILARAHDVPAAVVLIDGRSGSGKTTTAARVAELWGSPVAVLGLDDVYPGWDGLDAGVDEVLTRVLRARREGRPAVWRHWDWDAEGWAESDEIDGARPLVVEGSGILTPETALFADLTVWLSSPAAARKQRALARDGDLYRPHWDRWAAQEDRHVTRDRPDTLADLVCEIP